MCLTGGGILLKANDEMILREIAGQHILVPVGSAAVDVKDYNQYTGTYPCQFL